MTIFQKITILDLAKPLAARKRNGVGPYYWQPTDKRSEGRGFYMGKGMVMDRHGSTINLRVYLANDCLPSGSALRYTTGYYCDDFGDQTMQPVVVALPHKRGFMAGWTMGEGMISSFDYDLYGRREDAAYAAHSLAENAADAERRYRAENEPDDDYDDTSERERGLDQILDHQEQFGW